MRPHILSGLAAITLSGAITLLADRPADPPALFSTDTYAAARDKAAADHKLFIVDSTASWCGPCKQMDRTTWVDQRVIDWVAANAVAVQIDVDQEKDLARELRIRAMPTLIVFRDGQEADRTVGYRDAGALLAWLDGVKMGRKALDDAAARVRDAGTGPAEVRARHDLARELVNNGRFDEAADQYAWLWANIPARDSSMSGVRVSFIAGEIRQLIREHPDSAARFAVLRDETEARLMSPAKTWDDLEDWIRLNELIAQTDRTLEWFDRISQDPASAGTIARFETQLFDLLIERRRWADAGRILHEPAQRLNAELAAQNATALLGSLPEDQRELVRAYERDRLRTSAANLYTACLCARREPDADSLVQAALKSPDSLAMRFAMVRAAIDAGEPRENQRALLDQLATDAAAQAASTPSAPTPAAPAPATDAATQAVAPAPAKEVDAKAGVPDRAAIDAIRAQLEDALRAAVEAAK